MKITHSRHFDIATTRNTDEAVSPRYKKTLADVAVLVAVAIASPAALAPAAYAQDGEEKERRLEEVVVTGIRATVQSSIDLKRNSVQIVDGLSADEIGEIPALLVAFS